MTPSARFRSNRLRTLSLVVAGSIALTVFVGVGAAAPAGGKTLTIWRCRWARRFSKTATFHPIRG
jgi:hypothetical protein